jgi:hypothetical protein
MWSIDRREFLSRLSQSMAAVIAVPSIHAQRLFLSNPRQGQTTSGASSTNGTCWLDVCAPFIVEDDQRGIHTEIVLTSDTFVGAQGHQDGADATEYEIYLYDAAGRAVGPRGMAHRLTVPAMRTTVLNAQDFTGGGNFWGGMKIRLRARAREPMPASDLFSSAFVRWRTEKSFDNVHANPDPLQWQKAESFYYSMPFPPLAEYFCTFALFNPNAVPSLGQIVLFDHQATRVLTKRYELKAFQSLMLSLNAGEFATQPSDALVPPATRQTSKPLTTAGGGHLVVTNDQKSVKSFGYLLIRQPDKARFSVEHPIHQGIAVSGPEISPIDPSGNFKAKNVLYSPLLFRAKSIGPITLESRCFLSTGMCAEPAMWFAPFATDGDGKVHWNGRTDPKLALQLPAGQFREGTIRLAAEQSCILDLQQLSFKENFSGGLSLAISPDTTHTLMKMEVRVPEWKAHAFTHLRPGFRSARSYQKPRQRGGLATDYIASGARLERRENALLLDELIGVLNIDGQGVEGRPVLELFGPNGFLSRLTLGAVPGFAGRHYLLSDLAPGINKYGPLTLRLVDQEATLLMSILHIDYVRRDIALDHGSDRFSTLLEYNCNRAV